MTSEKWSDDAFLDRLRLEGDPLADRAVERLYEEHGLDAVNRIFKHLTSDHQPLPDDAPAPFREFMAATAEELPGLDLERLNRGADAFRHHVFPACVTLLAASLPSGYSAPCLSRVLTVSNDLGTHPYRRLMGVLQLIVNVSSHMRHCDGRAHLTARKMRLLHAGIRRLIPRYRPEFRERYGVPVNHEDMLATIMGFSYLVIEGLRRLGVGLTEEQAEDYYYVWRAFAQMCGIHPPGQPESSDYVPATVAEATTFYDSYKRRNFTGAEENPDGVDLSKVNLEMMKSLIPRLLRLLGFGRIPRIAMQEILGEEGMVRVGIQPIIGHHTDCAVFHALLRLTGGGAAERLSCRFGLLIFQRMIDRERGGEVTFIVPASLEEIRRDL